MTNDIDKNKDDIVKKGSDIDKGNSDIDKKGFDYDKNDFDIDKENSVIDKDYDKGVDYAEKGYVDREEAPVVRNVSGRTLSRDIEDLLKEMGLTWKVEPEELLKKTKKVIKKPVKGLLSKINFKWDISNVWLDELGREYRRERVVNVKKQPGIDKTGFVIDKIKFDYDKTKNDIDKIEKKGKEKSWVGDIGQKIKTALKWQGLKHEGDLNVLKKEIEVKDGIIVEQKKELKKKDDKISFLSVAAGREEGKVELLLEENEKLRNQLRLPADLRDKTAAEGSFKESKEETKDQQDEEKEKE